MTTVFNLIILDESGSMSHLTESTVSHCNEVLQAIKGNAERYKDTQRNLASIYAFQSGGYLHSRYIVKNVAAEDIKPISKVMYRPDGCTPLVDAIGTTLSELLTVAATHERSMGIITIITDGEENSSRLYTWERVSSLVSQAKELGWVVNLIGADIEVEAMGKKMNVENTMRISASTSGLNELRDIQKEGIERVSLCLCNESDETPMEDFLAERKRMVKDYLRKKEHGGQGCEGR